MGIFPLQQGTTQLGAGTGAVLGSHVGRVVSEPLSGPLLSAVQQGLLIGWEGLSRPNTIIPRPLSDRTMKLAPFCHRLLIRPASNKLPVHTSWRLSDKRLHPL